MMRDFERNRLELQEQIISNENLGRDLQINEEYRRRAENELKTIGEEVEKFKNFNEA